jgi:hypothetical protein
MFFSAVNDAGDASLLVVTAMVPQGPAAIEPTLKDVLQTLNPRSNGIR